MANIIILDVDKIKFYMNEIGYKTIGRLTRNMHNVDAGGVYNLMNGKVKGRPSLQMAVRLSQALNIPIEEIIKEIE